MANQTASPNEAVIAKEKLAAMAPDVSRIIIAYKDVVSYAFSGPTIPSGYRIIHEWYDPLNFEWILTLEKEDI